MHQSRTAKTFILSAANAMSSIAGMVSAMVLARIFSQQDYGSYRQALTVYMICIPLLGLGVPQAMYYFLTQLPNRKRDVLASAISILLCMAGLFAAVLWLGGAPFIAAKFDNPALVPLLQRVAFLPLVALPVLLLNPSLMTVNKVKVLAGFLISSRVIVLTAILIPAALTLAPSAALSGFVAASALVLIPAGVLLARGLKEGRFALEKSLTQRILKYAVPLGLAAMAGQLSLHLDKILVSLFYDPNQFAVYVNGAMEIPLIGTITGAATVVILPEINQLIKNKDSGQALLLWQRAAYKCSLILFPTMGFLLAMAPELMQVLYSDRYISSAAPFRVYLFLLPIRIAFFATLLMAADRSRLILWGTLGTLAFNLVLSLLLMKQIGYMGAAIATVLVIYCWTVPYNIYCIRSITGQYCFSFPLLKKLTNVALPCLVGGICCALGKPFLGKPLVALLVCGAGFTLLVGLAFHYIKLVSLTGWTSLFYKP